MVKVTGLRKMILEGKAGGGFHADRKIKIPTIPTYVVIGSIIQILDRTVVYYKSLVWEK